MTRSWTWFSAVPLLLVTSVCTFAQSPGPNDGILPFSTHEWGIDLATGAIYLRLPMRSKIGKLSYSAGIEGTDYYANGPRNGKGNYWNLYQGPAFFRDSANQMDVIGTILTQKCGNPSYWYMTYTATSIVDGTGAVHNLNGQLGWFRNNNSTYCPNQSAPVSLGVNDGTGYTLYVPTSGNPIVYDKEGNGFTIPVPGFSGYGTFSFSSRSTSVTDPDGASISWAGISGGAVTDTLNTTVLDLSNYSYTDALGKTQQYTLSYTPLPVLTNFGCTGILENSGTSTLLTSFQAPTGGGFTLSYEQTPQKSGYYTGRIAKITFPSGGSISYKYSDNNGHNGIDCSGKFVPIITVTVNDNNGYSGTYTYVHSNSSTAFTVTKTDPAGNQTFYNFTGEYQTEAQYYQGSATGTPLKTVSTSYSGNPITKTDVYTSLGKSASNRVTTTYDPTNQNVTSVLAYGFGASSPTSTTYIFYGQSWNGTSCTVYPTGTYIADTPCYIHTENSAGVDVAKTQITYSDTGHPTSTTRWTSASSSLTNTATYNTNGTVNTAKDANGTLYTYSYNGTGACNSLLQTSVTITGSGLPSGGLTTSTEWDCNGGVVTKSKDANGQPTTTNYTQSSLADPLYRPLSVIDAANFTTDFSYTPTTFETAMNFNGTISTTDGLATIDGLGRTIFGQQRQSQGSSTFDSIQTSYGWISASNGACTTQSPFSTLSCTTQTMPYSGTAGQSAPSGTAVKTSQYDAIGRVVSETQGTATSTSYHATYQYIQNDVLQTVGPSGGQQFQKQLEYDGLGRLTSVCEVTSVSGSGTCGQANAASGFLTTYTYDALGHLLTVTQDAQPGALSGTQTRMYNYDMLGRMTSETNAESGTTTYFWDAAPQVCWNNQGWSTPGDLGAKKTNSGNYTCNAYDGLHRLTGGLTVPSGPCFGFSYDAGTPPSGSGITVSNTAGHLIEAYTNNDCNGTVNAVTDEWFGYSVRGEITDMYTKTPNSNGYYHLAKNYWANGAVSQMSGLPGLPTIYYGGSTGSALDGEGRPTQVTASSGTGPVTCKSPPCVSYNTAGQVTNVVFGSGDSDSYQYDPNSGRMTQYTFAVNGSSVIGKLTWNPNGTLQKLGITDPLNNLDNQTCTFTYDDLGRLGGQDANGYSVDCGTAWAQTFSYDPFGNITKTGSARWVPGYNEATNQYLTASDCQTNGGIPCYDNDGQLLSDGFHTYQWNLHGHPIEIDGTTNQITYDAFGNLVEVYQPGWGTDQSLRDFNGQLLGYSSAHAAGLEWVPLPGGGVASYDGGVLQNYNHADWLGTTRLSSTPSQTLTQDWAHAPFGEEYAIDRLGQNAVDLFTGIGFSVTNDLYDTQYREYHPGQGRWISPDPAGLSAVDPTNPQTWNRYAYVANSPLTATDPLGLGPDPQQEIKNALSHACDFAVWTTRTGAPCGVGIPGQANSPLHCFIDNIETGCSGAAMLLVTGTAAVCPNNYCAPGTIIDDLGLIRQFQCHGDCGYYVVGVSSGLSGLGPLYPPSMFKPGPPPIAHIGKPHLSQSQAKARCFVGAQLANNGFDSEGFHAPDPGRALFPNQGPKIWSNSEQVLPSGSQPSVSVNPHGAESGEGADSVVLFAYFGAIGESYTKCMEAYDALVSSGSIGQ